MKKVLLGLSLLAAMATFTGTASAAANWYVCDAGRIGVSGDTQSFFKVANCDRTGGNDKWIEIKMNNDTTMATLLTARALGAKVKIQVLDTDMDNAGLYYKPLISMFLMEPGA